MAKLILYLHARRERAQKLVSAARALGSQALFDHAGPWLAVMQPRVSDLLAVPPHSAFLDGLAVIVEIVAPCGQPLASLRAQLDAALSPVLAAADTSRSHLAAGYHREFQSAGARPVRYHHLMYRLAHFTRADYLDYYVHHHARFGTVTPLSDYFQNYLDLEASRDLAKQFAMRPLEADSISELRFNSAEAYMSSDIIRDVGPAATADEERFVDRARGQGFSMEVLLDTRVYG